MWPGLKNISYRIHFIIFIHLWLHFLWNADKNPAFYVTEKVLQKNVTITSDCYYELTLETPSIIVIKTFLYPANESCGTCYYKMLPHRKLALHEQADSRIPHYYRVRCSINPSYLERTGHFGPRVAHVDESDHGQPDEQPTQEAHKVQQVVDISDEQEEHGEGVLHGAGGSTDFS